MCLSFGGKSLPTGDLQPRCGQKSWHCENTRDALSPPKFVCACMNARITTISRPHTPQNNNQINYCKPHEYYKQYTTPQKACITRAIEFNRHISAHGLNNQGI